MNNLFSVDSETSSLLPETLKMMEHFGIGCTRDKWRLDSIAVGGFRLVKASEMPSKNWTGPAISETQKATGLKISVRKTSNPEFPLVVIRLT